LGRIYLDSCIAIYLVERHPAHAAPIETLLDACESEHAVSPLVELECLVQPFRDGDLVRQRIHKGVFASRRLLPIGETAWLAAAQLRARFNLRAPDALHLACAQTRGCEALWTHDDRPVAAGLGLAVNLLPGTPSSAANRVSD
jgi:predicted nucleic acid-binding protein